MKPYVPGSGSECAHPVQLFETDAVVGAVVDVAPCVALGAFSAKSS